MEKEKINQFNYLFKFIIIGNSNTGKTCILHHFLENKFKSSVSHTIGVEFGSKILNLGDKNVKLQIWDTAGQERFRSITRTYYRGALGALIIYDTTNAESFESLKQWIKDAKEQGRTDITITIVGNKSDLIENREINSTDAAKFCQENELTFLETSAFTGENVKEVFSLLAKTILDKIQNGLIDPSNLSPQIVKKPIRDNKGYCGGYCYKN